MSKSISEKARINIYLPQDLKDWAWEEANRNGFSLTMMIQVMMLDYKKQSEALTMSQVAQQLMAKQNELQEIENDTK